MHSIAFPGISTGVYGYPKKEAAEISLTAVTNWLDENKNYNIEITFVNFSEGDYEIYKNVVIEKFSRGDIIL